MAIAVFDSGIGGLSVLQQARMFLPEKDYIYYADTAHVPYGTKSKEKVLEYVREAADFLLAQEGVEALVLACNTATSVAAPFLRAQYEVPILGMEPAVKPAVLADGAHRVLVTATPLTLHEKKMRDLLAKWDSAHLADLLPLPGLVELAERGIFTGAEAEGYLKGELAKYNLSDYSAIVLGCTHFNFFRETLRAILPQNMHIIDGTNGTVHNLAHQVSAKKEAGSVRYFNSYGEITDSAKLAYFQELLRVLTINMAIE